MTNPDPVWKRLTSAARARLQAQPAVDEAAPFGFSTRIVALWLEAREAERRLALWQRLSWRAAIASMAICAVVAVTQRGHADSGALLEPPALDLPGLDARS